MQRTRDGCSGHGEHVDLLTHLLEAFFVPDAESLFLVDDEQSDVLELKVLGKQAMRADEDIDLAGFEIFENDLLLLGRAEAGDHLDVDGELREAATECLVVLEAEDGGRGEDGYLFRVLYR